MFRLILAAAAPSLVFGVTVTCATGRSNGQVSVVVLREVYDGVFYDNFALCDGTAASSDTADCTSGTSCVFGHLLSDMSDFVLQAVTGAHFGATAPTGVTCVGLTGKASQCTGTVDLAADIEFTVSYDAGSNFLLIDGRGVVDETLSGFVVDVFVSHTSTLPNAVNVHCGYGVSAWTPPDGSTAGSAVALSNLAGLCAVGPIALPGAVGDTLWSAATDTTAGTDSERFRFVSYRALTGSGLALPTASGCEESTTCVFTASEAGTPFALILYLGLDTTKVPVGTEVVMTVECVDTTDASPAVAFGGVAMLSTWTILCSSIADANTLTCAARKCYLFSSVSTATPSFMAAVNGHLFMGAVIGTSTCRGVMDKMTSCHFDTAAGSLTPVSFGIHTDKDFNFLIVQSNFVPPMGIYVTALTQTKPSTPNVMLTTGMPAPSWTPSLGSTEMIVGTTPIDYMATIPLAYVGPVSRQAAGVTLWTVTFPIGTIVGALADSARIPSFGTVDFSGCKIGRSICTLASTNDQQPFFVQLVPFALTTAPGFYLLCVGFSTTVTGTVTFSYGVPGAMVECSMKCASPLSGPRPSSGCPASFGARDFVGFASIADPTATFTIWGTGGHFGRGSTSGTCEGPAGRATVCRGLVPQDVVVGLEFYAGASAEDTTTCEPECIAPAGSTVCSATGTCGATSVELSPCGDGGDGAQLCVPTDGPKAFTQDELNHVIALIAGNVTKMQQVLMALSATGYLIGQAERCGVCMPLLLSRGLSSCGPCGTADNNNSQRQGAGLVTVVCPPSSTGEQQLCMEEALCMGAAVTLCSRDGVPVDCGVCPSGSDGATAESSKKGLLGLLGLLAILPLILIVSCALMVCMLFRRRKALAAPSTPYVPLSAAMLSTVCEPVVVCVGSEGYAMSHCAPYNGTVRATPYGGVNAVP